MDSVSGVGVLDKSVAVLEVLAVRGPSSLASLVEATGYSRPTTHRLAVALEAHGLASRDERGRFRLGARLAAWGRSASLLEPVIAHAASVVADLRDATGESAQVYVREGEVRVCVAVAERPSGLRDTVPLGARLSLAAGSGAKVLLAWADPVEWPAGSSASALAAVRKRGWAASVEEREPGVASVSAPVRSPAGLVVAAIGVSGPVGRLTRRPGPRYAGAVVAAAGGLEARLA